MTDPLFDSRTARFGLPYLFAGQAQKEGFVNELAARIDALVHCAVEGEANSPPGTPVDGTCWLVGASPTGDWIGKAGQLAAREGGNWLFFMPRDGMAVLNRVTGQIAYYLGTWRTPPRPAVPSGGSVVDAEARTAIAALINCLTIGGIIPAP